MSTWRSSLKTSAFSLAEIRSELANLEGAPIECFRGLKERPFFSSRSRVSGHLVRISTEDRKVSKADALVLSGGYWGREIQVRISEITFCLSLP